MSLAGQELSHGNCMANGIYNDKQIMCWSVGGLLFLITLTHCFDMLGDQRHLVTLLLEGMGV